MVCVGAKGGVSGPAGGRADDRSFAHQLGIAHGVILGEDFRINQPLFIGPMHGLNSLLVLLRCGEEDGLAILNGHIVCVVAADIGSERKSVEVDRVSIAFPIGNLVVAALKKGIHWKALGFTQVLSAYQVEAARRILLTEKIDLLLSDIDMPGGSGLDLLRWMRGENDMTPCIFLTNYADFAYAQEAVNLKCFHYFLKPVDYEKLTENIAKAIAECEASHNDVLNRYRFFWQENILRREMWCSCSTRTWRGAEFVPTSSLRERHTGQLRPVRQTGRRIWRCIFTIFSLWPKRV